MFDFEQFCIHHNIDIGPSGHKHCQEGWVNIECPFCKGNEGYHLGWERTTGRLNCWRCGSHKPVEVIIALVHCEKSEAWRLLSQHKIDKPHPIKVKATSKIHPTELVLPAGICKLQTFHKQYLTQRHFDPDHLEREWHLLGTGFTGNYKFRVIAPIFFQNKMVSYQGRDITNQHELKYKACASNEEVRPHKHCLYGLDKVPGKEIVIVEGITDVWRLGPGAVATFGIKYKAEQVLLMKRFKRRFIMFDGTDPEAAVQAKRLSNELAVFNGETILITLEDTDPADLSQTEADDLMKDLIKGAQKHAEDNPTKEEEKEKDHS